MPVYKDKQFSFSEDVVEKVRRMLGSDLDSISVYRGKIAELKTKRVLTSTEQTDLNVEDV